MLSCSATNALPHGALATSVAGGYPHGNYQN